MLPSSKIKLISNLRRKKKREELQLFLVEGEKGINEFLDSGIVVRFIAVSENNLVDFQKFDQELIYNCTEKEMKSLSNLVTPPGCMAVFEMPATKNPDMEGLVVALDQVRDPGNLGTIIRLCDWFGVKTIICNPGTADCYNPKVVQATMGSLSRVNVVYQELDSIIKGKRTYAAVMDGENMYDIDIANDSVILLGNESAGVSEKIMELSPEKISIPRYGNSSTPESLNVATAAAILLARFRNA